MDSGNIKSGMFDKGSGKRYCCISHRCVTSRRHWSLYY